MVPAYSASPDPLAVFKGPTSKGREGNGGGEGKEKGRGGNGSGRREGRGREEEGDGSIHPLGFSKVGAYVLGLGLGTGLGTENIVIST